MRLLVAAVTVLLVVLLGASVYVAVQPKGGARADQPMAGTIERYYAHVPVGPSRAFTLCVAMFMHHVYQEAVECTPGVEKAIHDDSVRYTRQAPERIKPYPIKGLAFDPVTGQCIAIWEHGLSPAYIPGPCDPRMRAMANVNLGPPWRWKVSSQY